MRWAVALIVCIGCTGDDAEPSPRDEYYALEARIATDCGTYERNYPPTAEPPTQLCGAEPAVACINDAIAGASIAHLKYSYIDASTFQAREQNYYAGDGKLTWIGFYHVFDHEPAWYRADCTTLAAEPYEDHAMTCWTLKAMGCVARY